MKAFVSLLSVATLLAMTISVRNDQSWTGRIVRSESRYYFYSQAGFWVIANDGGRRDLAQNEGHAVRVTGELNDTILTVSKVESVEPIAQLERLFPTAVAFSPKGGDPAHYEAYTADRRLDPSATLLGFAFWTTDVVPLERGYEGPIEILVGMDRAGILSGVVVDYNSEPYGRFSVETPEFAAQFKGKSIRDPFRVGSDVDAVSMASISVKSAARAIRDSSRLVARQVLAPEAVK